jgi:type I restriction enzyme S subunit
VPVIGIRNVQDRLDLTDVLYLSGLKPAEAGRARVSAGWTVIVGSNGNRARIGNAVLIREDAAFLFASFLVGAKPKADSRLSSDYFYRWLSTEQVQAYLSASSEGTTGLNNLSHSFFRAMSIPVPPADEQAAIARILDAVDTALERTHEAVERARELEHSLLHDLLEEGLKPKGVTTHKCPPHWNIRRVDEVAEVGSGITLGKDVSGFKSIERPYLRVANVQDGHLDLSEIKTVRVRVEEVENYRLEIGDVLMTEGGDIDKLGRGAIWNGQIAECLHQNHIFRIRPDRAQLEPAFYALVVESDIAKRYFSRVAKRTTNLASTNKTQVRAFRFHLPPTLDEQRQITEVMKASKATTASLVEKQNALNALKASLLHDLLTGRVRVATTIKAATS